MKRLLMVGMLVGIGGCTAPSSQPAPQLQQQQQTTPPGGPGVGAKGPKNRTLTMYKNDNHVAYATAACLGSVTPYRGAAVMRNQGINWKIRDDDDEKCPGLDPTLVEVRFLSPILADPDNSNMPTDRLKGKAMGMKITGSIVANATAVPNGVYKYFIYYNNEIASEDPELDIMGDCTGSGCGPGS